AACTYLPTPRTTLSTLFPYTTLFRSSELEKTGNLMTGSRADLGRVGLGVVVREGANVPDVSTPDAFRKAMVEAPRVADVDPGARSEEHTSELQSLAYLVCRLLLENKI